MGPEPVRPNQDLRAGPVVGQELAIRFAAGERAAFAEVFELLRRDIFLLVRRFFASPFEQEEAVQEVWVQLHQARGRFDVNRHQDLVPWARQVARNRCRDLLRKRGRVREVPVEDPGDVPGVQQPDPLGEVGRARVREGLGQFAASLGQQDRRFFQLCFVEERGHAEVAGAMGITARRSKYLKKKMIGRMMKNSTLRRALAEAKQ